MLGATTIGAILPGGFLEAWEETVPETFAPPQNPSWGRPLQIERRAHVTDTTKFQHARALGLRDPKIIPIEWKDAGQAMFDYFVSFFHRTRTAAFFWTPFFDESPPDAAPELSEVTAGALGARTYYVAFSWYNSIADLETTLSPEASLAVSASKVLEVTVPIFPSQADRVRIYAGTSSGSLTLQTTTAARSWQEPASGLVAGASPPASNNLRVPLLWVLEGEYQLTPLRPRRWAIETTFREVFVA